MILETIFIFMLNVVCLSCEIQDPQLYGSSVQKIAENVFAEHSIIVDKQNSHTVGETMKNSSILFSSVSRVDTSPNSNWKTRQVNLIGTDEKVFNQVQYLVNEWLTRITHLNFSFSKTRKSGEKVIDSPHVEIFQSRDRLTFVQLWKKIREYGVNFTPDSIKYNLSTWDSSGRNYNGSYDRGHGHVPNALSYKDERYNSLVKKWIMNRHARHFTDNRENSTNWIIACNESPNACGSACPNESRDLSPEGNSLSNEKYNLTLSYENYNATNSNSKIHCNSTGSFSVSGNSNDNVEPRVYDPLMPYPEEYPEEYQTIQNGPALIISRTTYTRIPNVTYTMITMITLPTYRLVQKAEEGFAATFHDQKSSRNSSDSRCNEISSFGLLQQERLQ